MPGWAKEESRIYLLHSDRLYHDTQIDAKAQILVGNVQFRHDEVLMYCDSALFYEASNSLDAFGNVRMSRAIPLAWLGIYYIITDRTS